MTYRRLSGLIAPLALGLLAACADSPPPPDPALQQAADRLAIRELMDLYGTVHDMGTPEQYADLFTEDGEIATGGGPVLVKGREALMAQAVRDHERYSETDARGRTGSIMRHLITNAQVRLLDDGTAEGTCYVTTMVKKGNVGPAVLSISRYVDRYVKVDGQWRIKRREIYLEHGNQELGALMGFGGR
ncbi:MAG: nuclear transport factor 2 family protein [Pseudomonadota bacterium]|jgi:hypothetical protein